MSHWMDTGRFDDDSDIEAEPRRWNPLLLIAAQLESRFTRLGEWVRHAACYGRDATLWDAPPTTDELRDMTTAPTPRESARRQREAASVCASCPVRRECLADARANELTVGIRGGVLFASGGRADRDRVEHDLIALAARQKLNNAPAGRGRSVAAA